MCSFVDQVVVNKFLLHPSYLVENIWSKKRLTKLTNNNNNCESTYQLRMDSLILPGLDIITPEMQASFSSNNSIISMNSDKWKLLGNSKILNDNKFMKSFDIVSYTYYF